MSHESIDLYLQHLNESCTTTPTRSLVEWQQKLGWKKGYSKQTSRFESEQDLQNFTEALKSNKTMKSINLYCTQIGADGARAVASAIEINDTIAELGLGGNNIGDDGARAVASAMKINHTITELRLQFNQIGDDGARAVAEAIEMNNTITVLLLQSNQIGAAGARAIAEAMKINNTITVLSLGSNHIGDDGARAVAEAIKMNTTITVLDLSHNHIGDDGARAIAEAMKINNTITVTHLQSNQIGVGGARAVAEAMKINHTITELRLSHNQIGDDGARAIADAIKINHTITVLHLHNNQIGDDGARAVAEAIKINHTITDLHGVDLKYYLQLLSLPDEFSNKYNKDILAYLKELIHSSQQPTTMYRMRVMLVGPGEAGKTTLVHRILTGEFESGQFPLTDGVSMKEWSPDMTDQNIRISLSLWDFGGQEVYLHSHPILFSDRTLYLLVWNPRCDPPLAMLQKYVTNIRNRSRTAPIMLVTTRSSEAGERYKAVLEEISAACRVVVDESGSSVNHTGTTGGYVVRHFAVDSRTGDGIEQLKSSLIRFAMEEYADYARVLVPDWYGRVESRIRDSSFSSEEGRFSISREEFATICSSCWSHSAFTNGEDESYERVMTLLDLFHHWGVIYLLPTYTPIPGTNSSVDDPETGGDIVLNPQRLADVFKAVITCKPRTDCDRPLIEKGILSHHYLHLVWPEPDYQPRLRRQLLSLLHDCELAYEIFDEAGNPSGQSLVPSLLDELSPPLHRISEDELRSRMLDDWERKSDLGLKLKNRMISRGSVKIVFDSLLSNFFPKLLVRLRHISSSSVADCSLHHCVVHIPERVSASSVGRIVGWSVCCVVEDAMSGCLIVYPGGCSFDATSLVHQAIRYLLKESFAGMVIKDVMCVFDQKKLYLDDVMEFMREPDSQSQSMTWLAALKSVTCLFQEFEEIERIPDSPAPSSIPQGLHLPSDKTQCLSHLISCTNQYERSPSLSAKCSLSIALLKCIPIFREHGLRLDSEPKILWIVGRSSSCSPPCYHMVAVCPHLTPTESWEVVFGSRCSWSIHASHTNHDVDDGDPYCSELSTILLWCLKFLLPNHQLPSFPDVLSIDWVGLIDCRSQLDVIKSRESNPKIFKSDRSNIFGEPMIHSKSRLSILNEYEEILLVRYCNKVVQIGIPHLKQILTDNIHHEGSFQLDPCRIRDAVSLVLLG